MRLPYSGNSSAAISNNMQVVRWGQAMKFRKRNLISTGWYLTASIFGLGFIASIPGYYARFIQLPLQQHLGLGIVLISSVSGLVSLLTAATSLALAALLFFRKPDDRMAIFVSYFLLGYGVIMAGPLELLEYLIFGKTGAISLYAQYALITTPIFALLLLFPSGKFVPPQSRWILFISLLSILVLPWMNYEELYYLNTMRSQAVTIILTVLALIAFCSQIYRYLKKSTLIERQQTKVVVYGFGMWFFFMLISAPLYYLIIHSPQSNLSQAWQNASSIFWQLGLATIPISLTIAILRSHLWDVDVIIRRTLIYSLLTAVLGSLYLGSVILLQAIFSALGSQQ